MPCNEQGDTPMDILADVMRDKEHVRSNLYADPSKLEARSALHARFSTNPVQLDEWVLGLVDLTRVHRALDAGCGTGNFLIPLARKVGALGGAVVGLDIATGTLDEARRKATTEGLPVECIVGDIEALPFEDASFDLVLANYMLYHVPDLLRGIAELRRVLRPGGTLLAATNGDAHMAELWEIMEEGFGRAAISGPDVPHLLASARDKSRFSFSLQNGAQTLQTAFADVRLEFYSDELKVTEAEPLVSYVGSMWALDSITEALARTSQEQAKLRTDVLTAVRSVAADRVAADGVIRIIKSTGAFIAG
jgi:SAM-dependent methyltransferase